MCVHLSRGLDWAWAYPREYPLLLGVGARLSDLRLDFGYGLRAHTHTSTSVTEYVESSNISGLMLSWWVG